METSQATPKYVRFEHAGAVRYGLWENDVVRELRGSIFDNAVPSG